MHADGRAGTPTFSRQTASGQLDGFSELPGGPTYGALRAASEEIDIAGHRIRVASLDHLIAMKEASDWPKDRLMATEYRVISDELRAPRDPGDG